MRVFIYLIFAFSLLGCSRVPDVKLKPFNGSASFHVESDTLNINLSNPLKCPLRILPITKSEAINKLLGASASFTIPPETDTTFFFPLLPNTAPFDLSFRWIYGDLEDEAHLNKLSLPIPTDRQFKIIQAYNGSFSHSSSYQKYALDINLNIGDTIYSAAGGYVVGVVEGYKEGGESKEWEGFANYITLFHPEMNVYTQYVHLSYQGSFTEVGDWVGAGQPIGISGMTGRTDVEHLHFNVLKAAKNDLESIPYEFNKGLIGTAIKTGDIIQKRSK